MKKNILLFLLLVFGIFAYSQDIMSDVYDGIPASMKKRIFLDNFDNNNYSWIKNTSPSTHRISDGFLYFSNEYDFPYIDGKSISFDGEKNWQIEAQIKFISGNVETFNGLMWGQLIFGKKYILSFSSLGYQQIEIIDGYEQSFLLQPINTGIINQTDENELVVRKYGSKYYFFINKSLIFTSNFESLSGQYIGFSVSPNSMIRINYLRLWYIE